MVTETTKGSWSAVFFGLAAMLVGLMAGMLVRRNDRRPESTDAKAFALAFGTCVCLALGAFATPGVGSPLFSALSR